MTVITTAQTAMVVDFFQMFRCGVADKDVAQNPPITESIVAEFLPYVSAGGGRTWRSPLGLLVIGSRRVLAKGGDLSVAPDKIPPAKPTRLVVQPGAAYCLRACVKVCFSLLVQLAKKLSILVIVSHLPVSVVPTLRDNWSAEPASMEERDQGKRDRGTPEGLLR